jgi:hypothetical protein
MAGLISSLPGNERKILMAHLESKDVLEQLTII